MSDREATLCLCGDVMLGRGIDQILAHPADPQLYEPCITDAAAYVALAEQRNGPIPRPVEADYVWGDALAAWRRARADARIINLETSITASLSPRPKGINYKMDPRNGGVLTAAGIDCCVLANNHVLDWGEVGLGETLAVLDRLRIAHAGAGPDAAAAAAPAIVDLGGGRRAVVLAFGMGSSGIPVDWAARSARPGVNRLVDLTPATVQRVAARIAEAKRPGDIAVVSIHWGGNWGYRVPEAHRAFAHGLIERAGADVVHGHSSHHAKAVEIHRGKPILYGCGDFLNDYEGIAGYEGYRGDLVVSYLASFSACGDLTRLAMLPFRIRRFRLGQAEPADREWLYRTLDRESAAFGTRIVLADNQDLAARW